MGLHTHTDVLAHIFLRQGVLQNSCLYKAGLFVCLICLIMYTLTCSSMALIRISTRSGVLYKVFKMSAAAGAVSVRQLYYIWNRG